MHIDFQKCRKKIAISLNEFCNRWFKREHVECDALKDWKLNIFKIIDRRTFFLYFFVFQFILKILKCYHVNLGLVIVI